MKKDSELLDRISHEAGGIVSKVAQKAQDYGPRKKGKGQGLPSPIPYDEFGNPMPQPDQPGSAFKTGYTYTPGGEAPTGSMPPPTGDQGVQGIDPTTDAGLAATYLNFLKNQAATNAGLAATNAGLQSQAIGAQTALGREGIASQERMFGQQLASTEALTREWYQLTSDMQTRGLDAEKAMHAASIAEAAERRLMEERLGMAQLDSQERMALMNILQQSKALGVQAWMSAMQTQEAGLSRRAQQATQLAGITSQYNLGLLDRARNAAYAESLRGNQSPLIRSRIPERFMRSPAEGVALEPVANVPMPSTEMNPEQIKAILAARKGGGQGQGKPYDVRAPGGAYQDESPPMTMPRSMPAQGPNELYRQWISKQGETPAPEEKTKFWESIHGQMPPMTPPAGFTEPEPPKYVPTYQRGPEQGTVAPGTDPTGLWMETIARTVAGQPDIPDPQMLQYLTGYGIPANFANQYLQTARGWGDMVNAEVTKGTPYTQAFNNLLNAGIPQAFLVNYGPMNEYRDRPLVGRTVRTNEGEWAYVGEGPEHAGKPWIFRPSNTFQKPYYAAAGPTQGGGQGQGMSFLGDYEMPTGFDDTNQQAERWLSGLHPDYQEEIRRKLTTSGMSLPDYYSSQFPSEEEGFYWAIPGALRAIASGTSLPPGPVPSGLKLPTAAQSANMAPSEWGLVQSTLESEGIPYEDYINAVRWHTPPWTTKPKASSYVGF